MKNRLRDGWQEDLKVLLGLSQQDLEPKLSAGDTLSDLERHKVLSDRVKACIERLKYGS